MTHGPTPSHHVVLGYMRDRRKNYFFNDNGPALPHGVSARWRSALNDPRGWHSNMIGALDGPVALVGEALDIAVAWFGRRGADTWVDVDEWSVLWGRDDLLRSRGFVLRDDWDVMVCSEHRPAPPNPAVILRHIETRADFRVAAHIAEQAEPTDGVPTRLNAERRMDRYWREYQDWDSYFVLADLNGEPVGTARLTEETVPVVVGVATLEHARGRGVATAVTDALTARALAQHGVCALYVDRGSQAARIYGRLGFQPLFRTRAWVRRLERG